MLGSSHAIMSFAIVYGVSGSPLAASITTVGAIFPDRIERVIYGRKWLAHHRQWSHWFVPYLALWWLCQTYMGSNGANHIVTYLKGVPYVPIDPESIVAGVFFTLNWFSIGALLHIVEDSFFGAIPVLIPWRRHRLFFQLFKTGSLPERILARIFLISAVVIRFVESAGGVAK